MVPRVGTAARIAAVADLGLRRSRLLDAETLAAGGTLFTHGRSLALVILLLLAGLDLLLAGVGVDDGLTGSLQALGLETFALELRIALFFSRAMRSASSLSSCLLKTFVRLTSRRMPRMLLTIQ